MKNKKLKTYVVSSADWEIDVDSNDCRSAATSGLIYQFTKFRDKLLLSTVIMVNQKDNHINRIISSSEFFATYEIFNEIGMTEIAEGFLEFTKLKNETKYS